MVVERQGRCRRLKSLASIKFQMYPELIWQLQTLLLHFPEVMWEKTMVKKKKILILSRKSLDCTCAGGEQ